MRESIIRYIIAAVNLYGIIDFSDFIGIYKTYKQTDIEVKELENIVTEHKVDLTKGFVVVRNNQFIAMDILLLDNIEIELAYKEGKSHYIPAEEKFLEYEKNFYFEKTSEYIDLLMFLKSNLKDEKKAEQIAKELQLHCKTIEGVKNLSGYIKGMSLNFNNDLKNQTFITILREMSENTRMRSNNGFTVRELEGLKK